MLALCSDSNAQDYRAKIDFTGKMKGNCIFNNLTWAVRREPPGCGLGAVRKIPPSVPGNLAGSTAQPERPQEAPLSH